MHSIYAAYIYKLFCFYYSPRRILNSDQNVPLSLLPSESLLFVGLFFYLFFFTNLKNNLLKQARTSHLTVLMREHKNKTNFWCEEWMGWGGGFHFLNEWRSGDESSRQTLDQRGGARTGWFSVRVTAS